jgi:hypothetical protein
VEIVANIGPTRNYSRGGIVDLGVTHGISPL